ncbi:MAG: hypothetical protein KGQ59_01170 [Bdellovibrionales bacterium]|nr:hypothetical protein [Bdellovibrionales bacterium]
MPCYTCMYRLFQDRWQAGEALAEQLITFGWNRHPPERLFGLARGGVVVAAPAARRLAVPLEVLVVRKIGAPDQEEFGVGAICEDSPPLFSHDTLKALHLEPADLIQTVRRKRIEADEKIRKYRGSTLEWKKAPQSVLIIDDGLATGISAEAAARYIRKLGVGKLTLGVPVAAADSAEALKRPGLLYDEVIALERLQNLGSIGSWYESFSSVSDDEVTALLQPDRSKAVA